MDVPPDVVGRISLVLHAVSGGEPAGVSTASVARSSGLARPTAHRLLSSLAERGLLERDRQGMWLLGPELFLLGLAAGSRYDTRSIAHPLVRKLADETGESAFFSAVRGLETVCLLREEGAFPIRSHVLYEGVRFPLGVASAGLAALSFLPEKEIEAYLASRSLEEEFGPLHSADAIWRRIRETQAKGWSLNPGLIVEGSWGMAAAVFGHAQGPVGALTLTGVEARFDPARQRQLGALLLGAAHELTNAVRRRR